MKIKFTCQACKSINKLDVPERYLIRDTKELTTQRAEAIIRIFKAFVASRDTSDEEKAVLDILVTMETATGLDTAVIQSIIGEAYEL